MRNIDGVKKLRKQAIYIASLLPDDRQEAVIILQLVRDLLDQFLFTEDGAAPEQASAL